MLRIKPSRSSEVALDLILSTPSRRDVDRLFRALPRVEHIIVTVLADKMDFLRELSSFGFEFAAYLPAWFKGGAFRYDCIQLVLRRRRAQRAARDCPSLLSRFQREIVSDRRSTAALPPPRPTRPEDLDMSTVTIAGLPVLAIIEDSRPGATGNARRRAEDPRPLPPGRPPRESGWAASSIGGRMERPRTASSA